MALHIVPGKSKSFSGWIWRQCSIPSPFGSPWRQLVYGGNHFTQWMGTHAKFLYEQSLFPAVQQSLELLINLIILKFTSNITRFNFRLTVVILPFKKNNLIILKILGIQIKVNKLDESIICVSFFDEKVIKMLYLLNGE